MIVVVKSARIAAAVAKMEVRILSFVMSGGERLLFAVTMNEQVYFAQGVVRTYRFVFCRGRPRRARLSKVVGRLEICWGVGAER